MSHPDLFSSWKALVSSAFPHLSRPQATVLALWSYGMVLAKACGVTLVSAVLALQLGRKEASLVQRLREWRYAAPDKKGAKRREVDVHTCFAPLLRWLLSWWPAEEPPLELAHDATTLSDRFTVLAISVLYRGCAIPVDRTSRDSGHQRVLATVLEGSPHLLAGLCARSLGCHRDE